MNKLYVRLMLTTYSWCQKKLRGWEALHVRLHVKSKHDAAPRGASLHQNQITPKPFEWNVSSIYLWLTRSSNLEIFLHPVSCVRSSHNVLSPWKETMFLDTLFNSEFLGGLELEHCNPEIWVAKLKSFYHG